MGKHKVFTSYYHHDDQRYRDSWERKFGHLLIPKSVQAGDIDADNSAEYIKRLIQLDFIGDASVVVVLVAPKTKCRKHVDWEISAGLSKKVNGCSGLLGVLLPEFPLSSDNKYQYEDLPARLADNVQAGFAKVYTWNSITAYDSRVTEAIDDVFDRRIADLGKVKNGREQMQRNTCD